MKTRSFQRDKQSLADQLRTFISQIKATCVNKLFFSPIKNMGLKDLTKHWVSIHLGFSSLSSLVSMDVITFPGFKMGCFSQ